ncbi:MAG: hypothetical protein ACOX8A_07560 [Thermacetogeniaceae bacterium]
MTALIYRMVIACMAGNDVAELYEQYVKERRLHVTVAEIIQAKRETA